MDDSYDCASVDLPQLVESTKVPVPAQENVSFANEANTEVHIPQYIPFLGVPSKGRTLSIALPSSLIDNAQTPELKAYLVGQIARTVTIFGIDEVVIFEDLAKAVNFGCPHNLEPYSRSSDIRPRTCDEEIPPASDSQSSESLSKGSSVNQFSTALCKGNPETDLLVDRSTVCEPVASHHSDSDTTHSLDEDDLPEGIENFDDRKWSKALYMFYMNLAYLETPQYMRRELFKLNPTLRLAGLQNPLDAPHHLRAHEWVSYREGIVTEMPSSWSFPQKYSCVNCGLSLACRVPGVYPIGSRVTVKFNPSSEALFHKLKKGSRTKCFREKRFRTHTPPAFEGKIVSSREPTDNHGLYWGYRVRAARSLKEALNACCFTNGRYDMIIGTSERGSLVDPSSLSPPENVKHILIVFGPVSGLESCIEDEQSEVPIGPPQSLFDHYINVCHLQKSRTIRTEEALMMTLTLLCPTLSRQQQYLESPCRFFDGHVH